MVGEMIWFFSEFVGKPFYRNSKFKKISGKRGRAPASGGGAH